MRRFHLLVASFLVALWLPATLRCEIEAVPGLEFLGCTTPCDGPDGGDCGDGCNILETGLFKVSTDDGRLAPPTLTLLCSCLICELAPLAELVIEPMLSPPRKAESWVRQRTWHFVQRAAPPSRAPSL